MINFLNFITFDLCVFSKYHLSKKVRQNLAKQSQKQMVEKFFNINA